MSLLTTQDVTKWLPQVAGNETRLAEAIAMAEARANRYCRRTLESTTHTDYYSPPQYLHELVLRNFPVTAVTSVEESPVDSPTTLDADDDYFLDDVAGIMARGEAGYWLAGPKKVKVVYTAGYTASDLAGDQADLKEALIEIVGWMLGVRGDFGAKSESADGHSSTKEDVVRGLPVSLGSMLDDYVKRF